MRGPFSVHTPVTREMTVSGMFSVPSEAVRFRLV